MAEELKSPVRRILLAAAGAALVLALIFAPDMAGEYRTLLLAQALIYAIAAISLDVVWGYTGIPDLGHAVWFGTGALAVALITGEVDASGMIMQTSTSPFAYIGAAAVGTIAAALLAAVVGWYACTRKASSFYIAIVGLALAFIAQPLYTQFPAITGGEQGLFGFKYDAISTRAWYYIILGVTAVVLAVSIVLVRSDFGTLMRAVRDNEKRARYIGFNVEHVKIAVYAFGAAISGLAGALFGSMFGVVSAPLFGFLFATEMLVWVALGGRSTIIGPFIGAIGLSLVGSELNASFPTQWAFLVGVLFVVVVVFIPDGLLPPLTAPLRRLLLGRGASLSAGSRTLQVDESGWALPTQGQPVIAARNVEFSYGALKVLRGVDLDILGGELLCIVGPNGAGKSTFIEVVTDASYSLKGEVTFATDRDGASHGRLEPDAATRAGIIRKFQIPQIFSSLTVAEHLLLAGLNGRWPSVWRRTHAVKINKPAADLFAATGLAGKENVRAPFLAHGLKQGLDIAMAVNGRPKVLLLDEPTAGLTTNERGVVGEVLREIAGLGITVVLIEHDLDFVERVADRVAVLHGGRVLETGSPAQIRASEAVKSAYIGQAGAATDKEPAGHA